MSDQQNIFEKLLAGISIENISERDAEIISQLYATGNEGIVLSSDCLEINTQIEEANPFTFSINFEDGAPVLNVFPDGSPDGKLAPFGSGFALCSDVVLKWI